MEKAAYINSVSHIFLILPLPMRIWKTISEKLVEIRQGFVPLSLDKMEFLSKYNNISRHITNRRHCKQMYGMSIFITR